MTSLSSMSATSMSPADRMKLTLQSMVSAGSVKSADQSALSGALDDIDTAMKASRATAGAAPGTMKSKVDSLVDQEVSDGKLTADQATELKDVFAKAAHGMHHAHGGGGPPPPPSNDADDGSTTATSSTSSTDSTKQAIETLIAFLKQLEQATSSSTNYTSSGSTSASNSSALLVNASA